MEIPYSQERYDMDGLAPTGPNAEQIQYWNDQGHRWVALQEFIDVQIQPLGEHAMDRAGIGDGHHVLDVGCGCGQTTLELARRVGASGKVVGIDISTIMLEKARERARSAGTTSVSFENADAQVHRFAPASIDHVFSRFGVMFFSDPAEAFRNLRTALRPGGCLTFVCWQGLRDNAWMFVPLMAVAQCITLPPPPPPGAPGPFAFADATRVRSILEAAGFTDIIIEAREETLNVGGGADLDTTVRFILQIGPAASALREAGAQAEERVTEAVRGALKPYQTAAGIRLPGAAWIVRARA